MSKKLSEISLKELFHLFPISLVDHKNEWKEQFNEEKIFEMMMKILSQILMKVRWISNVRC